MKQAKRGDVRLSYEIAGEGDPTILLLHCWGGDHTMMAPQFEHFRKTHRTIALDLRGHGESDKPADGNTIAGYADDAAWLCEHLGIARVVAIGHSLGGAVALEMAARHPARVSAVVMLESLVVPPVGIVNAFRPVLEGLRTEAYPMVMKQFQGSLLGDGFGAARKEELLARFAKAPAGPMISALSDQLSHDSDASAAKCMVPALYVSSGPWYTDVARFQKLCPTMVTAQTFGSGHHLQIEVADQVHPIVDRFLKLRVPKAA